MTRRVFPDWAGETSLKTPDGRVFLDRVAVARGFIERSMGLIGRCSLEPGRGLLFPDCRAVHTFFMGMAIDVIFLDAEMRVAGIEHALEPWRMAVCRSPAARHTLETAAGAAAAFGLAEGDALCAAASCVKRLTAESARL